MATIFIHEEAQNPHVRRFVVARTARHIGYRQGKPQYESRLHLDDLASAIAQNFKLVFKVTPRDTSGHHNTLVITLGDSDVWSERLEDYVVAIIKSHLGTSEKVDIHRHR